MSRVRSRKLWMAVVAAVMPTTLQLVTDGVGWDRVVVYTLGACLSYVAVQGWVDGQEARRGPRV